MESKNELTHDQDDDPRYLGFWFENYPTAKIERKIGMFWSVMPKKQKVHLLYTIKSLSPKFITGHSEHSYEGLWGKPIESS